MGGWCVWVGIWLFGFFINGFCIDSVEDDFVVDLRFVSIFFVLFVFGVVVLNLSVNVRKCGVWWFRILVVLWMFFCFVFYIMRKKEKKLWIFGFCKKKI